MAPALAEILDSIPNPPNVLSSYQGLEFTYEVGRMMDEGRGQMEASLVKLITCKSAEWVTREAMQLHGGMGYAEETAVSRYWLDARVLSIFEGTEETLALKVVGRTLIEQAA